LLIILAAMPSLGLILWAAREDSRRAVAQADEEAVHLVRRISFEQERTLHNARSLLILLSYFPAFGGQRKSDCSSALAALQEHLQGYGAFAVFTPEGEILSASRPLTQPDNSSHLTWWQNLRETNEFSVGEYQLCPMTGKPLLVVGYPILGGGGRLRGAVAAGIDLTWLGRTLAAVKPPAGATVTIFDRSGTVLARQPDPEGLTGRSVPEYESLLPHLTGVEDMVQTEEFGKGSIHFTLASLGQRTKGIYILVSVSRQAVLATSRWTMRRNLMGLGLATALALIAAWLVGNMYIVRPVRRMVRSTERIEAGDLSTRTDLTDRGGQLHRLGWALDKMARSLEERQLQAYRAQEELEKSESLLRETQRLAKTGGWEMDLATEKVYWTDEVYRIRELDHRIQPDLELNWSLYPPQEREITRRMVARARASGEPWDLELKTETAAGRQIWVRTIGKALVKRGRIVKLYGAYQDITDQKEAQEARERLKHQLRQARRLEALGTLAGGIAHDFNNIMTSIMGYLQLAQSDTDRAHPAKKYLHQIQEAGARAQSLVGQILSFSRQAKQKPVPTSLIPIIEEAVRIVRPSLGPGIEIKRRIEDRSGRVMVDPTQIHQVLMNLLTNAAQAIEEEPGLVEIFLDRAELGWTEDRNQRGLRPGAYQRLRVCDNGKGMDQRTLEKIFDPFFTTKEAEEGTGMGLAVVHGIIKGHRGGINVISRPGQGSTFEVLLPLAEEKGPPC